MREAGYEFLEIAFALGGGNRRSWTIIVVEGLYISVCITKRFSMRQKMTYQIVVVLVVDEIFLGEKVAESRVAESMGFVRAQLKHGDGISGSQIQAENLKSQLEKALQLFLIVIIGSLPETAVERLCC